MQQQKSLWDKATDKILIRLVIGITITQYLKFTFLTAALTMANSLITINLASLVEHTTLLPNLPNWIFTLWNWWQIGILLLLLYFLWFWVAFKNSASLLPTLKHRVSEKVK